MRDSRSAASAVVGAAAGMLAVRAFVTEPRRLVVRTHIVRLGVDVACIARIVQLSDLHLRGIGVLERRVLHAVRMARPDLIVITGDVINHRPALGALRRLLDRLADLAPILAVLGNWDRWSGVSVSELRDLYARYGGTLLVNESVVVPVHETRMRVTGVDDLVTGAPSARAGLEASEPGEMHLILAHCPGYRERLWREVAEMRRSGGWGAAPGDSATPALMIAGHTHGGQIRLLGVAPVRPRGSGRYVSGWYRDARPHLYVSAGLGTSGMHARLGAPPEVAVFDVELPARSQDTPSRGCR